MRSVAAIVLLLWAVCYGRCLAEQYGELNQQTVTHCCGKETKDAPFQNPLSTDDVCEFIHTGGALLMQPVILELVQTALDELIATRRREGEKLADMIRERVARMRELVTQATPRMPAVVLEYQERLTAKLRDAVASLDEDRVRQEVAL